MRALLEKDKKWNYLINLCGQDFPIKSNLEIAAELKSLKGSVIESTLVEKEVSWFRPKPGWFRRWFGWFGMTSHAERYMNR